jgi:hypothetical protein
MPTLYRSPTLVIGEHEWHLRVETDHGRPFIAYRFRPADKPAPWQSAQRFPGRMPKGMWKLFQAYIPHARIAAAGPKRVA